jgi:1-aminocyclopropane-1-carboxylate deaminase/D-cysteine desulfhydrase-like pyridoxal-dependent ACC family enzyme
MIGLARSGAFGGRPAIFLHTGGTPALFGYGISE